MRKIIALMLLACILFGLVACKTDVGQKNEIIQEDKDDFSEYNMQYFEGIQMLDNGLATQTEMNVATSRNAEYLYKGSDYVVVATPIDTFEQSNQLWNDKTKTKTDDFSQADITYSHTERKLKILKVYKGENSKVKELICCETIISDGTEMKLLFEEDYPLVKGEKYLLFLDRANTEQEMYFASPKQGIYSLDSDKNTSNLEKQVKEMFKDEFKDK